jgi:hypothetical protein
MENTEVVLLRDHELYDEYMRLPKQKKKEQMFLYLRKFNERNPLYIPVK